MLVPELSNSELESKKTKILILVDDLLNEIEQDNSTSWALSKKWEIELLDENFDFHETSKDSLLEFQIKNGIKLESNNFVQWNPDYKKEAITKQFVWVLHEVKHTVLSLKQDIISKFDEESEKHITKLIRKKIKYFNKLIDSVEGRCYCIPAFRKTINNLHKERFDVIWDCNELYTHWPEILRKSNPKNYAKNFSYPFIDIDIQQWIDFENANRILPFLKKSIAILMKETKKLKESITPLQQIAFIDFLRNTDISFKDLKKKEKIKYLNLITNGNNHDLNLQLNCLEDIIEMDIDDYENLQDKPSEFSKMMSDILVKNEDNIRKKLRVFTSKVIQPGVNKTLSEEEKKYNLTAKKNIESVLLATKQVEKLFEGLGSTQGIPND